MLMADTMAIFFVILGLLLAFPGLWLLCRGLWPEAVAGAADRCRKGLIMPGLVGLPVTAGVLLASVALGKLSGTVGKIAGIGLVCVYMAYAHCGVAGLATLIGQRLPSPADAERPWKATLRGGLALELSYLLPILGWFVILPLSIVLGCGAVTLALSQSRSLPASATGPVSGGEAAGVPVAGPAEAPR